MKGKGMMQLIISAIVIAAAVLLAIVGIGGDKLGSISNVKLGLDLAGGVSITYEAVEEDPTSTAMDDTVYKMQQRAQSFSTESSVYPIGSNRVGIDIPDVTDADAVLEQLGSAGNIYFIYAMSANGVQNIEYAYDETKQEYGYKLLRTMDEIIADGDVVIDGSDITGADPNVYQQQLGTEYVVDLKLTAAGTTKFAAATEYAVQFRSDSQRNYQNLIAIVYDNEVISAPGVESVITGGTATITGQSNYDESKILATTIRIGALPLELSVLRYSVVGAKLGAEAIDTSILAGIIGFFAIVIFMIVMYRVPGLAASLALVLYTALMIICLNIFGVTLTLPGIAGIILSVGMAVDANVIIFTRIQEELAVGKTVRSSIKSGFSKALSAIIDGNVTTILAAAVLYFIGSGTVRGFAQTLAIGIVLSMLTALFVTKFILGALFSLGANKVGMYGIKKQVKVIPFVQNFKKFLLVSIGLIVIGIVAVVINISSTGKAFNYGLDFMGGTVTTATFNDTIPDNIQVKLEDMLYDSLNVSSEITISDDNAVSIKTRELSTDERAILADRLVSDYSVEHGMITTESVGATVSGEMKKDAIVAVIVATLGMLLYIWFRFKNINFALSSVLALVHDVLVVLMVYAVCRSFISVGSTFIACMLTIVGYSINATIVIFDRIRENMKEKLKKDTIADVVNLSVSQSLSRSVNTSLTTFFMVFMLALLGVNSVKEFAIPLMAGIVCGGFSSVCIAGGLWYTLQTKVFKGNMNEKQ